MRVADLEVDGDGLRGQLERLFVRLVIGTGLVEGRLKRLESLE